MNFENSIPFDLGFYKHLDNVVENLEYAYYELNGIKNFNTKKFQFQRYLPLIQEDVNTYLNFYIGCMLWACYIKQFENKEISNNDRLDKEISDEDGFFTINYLKNYLTKFEKDTKYYLNKPLSFDKRANELLNLYTKFLSVNNHFTQTKTSSDLVLPFKIEAPNYEEYLNVIQTVIETGDFSPLRNYLDLLLDNAI